MVSIVLYSNLAAVNRGCTNWTGRGGDISLLRPCITDRGYSLLAALGRGFINYTGMERGCVRLQDASWVSRRLATTYLPPTPLVTRVSPVGRQNCLLVVPLDSTENVFYNNLTYQPFLDSTENVFYNNLTYQPFHRMDWP